ncbi:unnamed protein product [Darwinula stevensoni]|uniref:Uncharacterized protein n=1 Tax=Darwinula stevensoni TaxID=69355 RepID=A0A7R8X1I1_9CRUS|nr:unnamed protein product [Darwinula stevensoni]CAG0880306.1 unnamed protein product [Darwinula stevensoni]
MEEEQAAANSCLRIPGPAAEFAKCEFCSSALADLPTGSECRPCGGGFDIRDFLKVHVGAGTILPFEEAAGAYIQRHYPGAGETHYSLPSDLLARDGEARRSEPGGDGLEPDDDAVAAVFDRAKEFCGSAPSLVIADFKLCNAIKSSLPVCLKQRRKKLSVESDVLGLPKDDRNVFLLCSGGNRVYGIFFEIKRTTSKEGFATVSKRIREAIHQCDRDVTTLKLTCAAFLNSGAFIAAFPSVPFLKRSDLQTLHMCDSCARKVLTGDDLRCGDDFRKFLEKNNFQEMPCIEMCNPGTKTLYCEAFSLCACAHSSVRFSRMRLQNTKAREERNTLCILTPEQKRLVDDRSSWPLLIAGGSGTGKTLVLKERARRLAEDGVRVVVFSFAGERLTKILQDEFREDEEIRVVQGREEDLWKSRSVLGFLKHLFQNGSRSLEEDFAGFWNFLKTAGGGGHVLVDDVSVDLGFPDVRTAEDLDAEWRLISGMKSHFRSVTIAFRTNDPSYWGDPILQDLMANGSYHIALLTSMKRCTKRISELLLAIQDIDKLYFTPERTIKLELAEQVDQWLPRFIVIPSHCRHWVDKNLFCPWLEMACAIEAIYEKYSSMLPLVVVCESRFWGSELSIPFVRVEGREAILHNGRRGMPPVVVVSRDEILGCHLRNATVVVDLDLSWQGTNKLRVIAPSGDNKILLITKRDAAMGKFSDLVTGNNPWKIKMQTIDDVCGKMKTRKREKEAEMLSSITLSDFKPAPVPFPQLEMNFDVWEEEDEADVKKILGSWLTGIFGYPASGKSRKVDRAIKRVVELRGGVLLLLCGSEIFNELSRRRWKSRASVEVAPFRGGGKGFRSLRDVAESVFGGLRGYFGRVKREDVVGPVVVVVEDCPLWKGEFDDVDAVVKRLKANGVKVILSFKSHSVRASEISVERVINALEENEGSIAIAIRSQPTNHHLLDCLIQNESSFHWSLNSTSLCLLPEAVDMVDGPPVQYVKYSCSGRHLGYSCLGKNYCGNNFLVLTSLVQSLLPESADDDRPQVLREERKEESPEEFSVKTLFGKSTPEVDKVPDEALLGGILLVARVPSEAIRFIPIAPYLNPWSRNNTYDMWMPMTKLPEVLGEDRVPPSLRRISFRGSAAVLWDWHTEPLLRALDMHLAGALRKHLRVFRQDRDHSSLEGSFRHFLAKIPPLKT